MAAAYAEVELLFVRHAEKPPEFAAALLAAAHVQLADLAASSLTNPPRA